MTDDEADAYYNKWLTAKAKATHLEAKVKLLTDALDMARNGLVWYRDTYPEANSEADDEALVQIDAALAA